MHVNILDVNDNSPIFDDMASILEITENSANGTFLGIVFASDLDDNEFGAIKFSTTSEIIDINEKSGKMTLKVGFKDLTYVLINTT